MLRLRRFCDDDVFACLDLDPGYVTGCTWQLERNELGEETQFHLRPVALPRRRAVDGYPIEPALEDRLERADLALLLEDDEPVAYILAGGEPPSLVLDMLVVRPERRGQRLGARLLNEMRDWARQRCYHWLQVTVEARNFPAIQFLRKYGFTIRGVRDADRDTEVLVELARSVG